MLLPPHLHIRGVVSRWFLEKHPCVLRFVLQKVHDLINILLDMGGRLVIE